MNPACLPTECSPNSPPTCFKAGPMWHRRPLSRQFRMNRYCIVVYGHPRFYISGEPDRNLSRMQFVSTRVGGISSAAIRKREHTDGVLAEALDAPNRRAGGGQISTAVDTPNRLASERAWRTHVRNRPGNAPCAACLTTIGFSDPPRCLGVRLCAISRPLQGIASICRLPEDRCSAGANRQRGIFPTPGHRQFRDKRHGWKNPSS